jgi:hypothetical protein
VAGNSGWHWDDKKGANIDADSKSTWDDYVKAHPKTKPFRNRGWPFRAAMAELMPVHATGAHVYRPSQGAHAPGGDSDQDNEDDDEENDKSDGEGADSDDQTGPPPRDKSPIWDIEERSSSPNGHGRTSRPSSEVGF